MGPKFVDCVRDSVGELLDQRKASEKPKVVRNSVNLKLDCLRDFVEPKFADQKRASEKPKIVRNSVKSKLHWMRVFVELKMIQSIESEVMISISENLPIEKNQKTIMLSITNYK